MSNTDTRVSEIFKEAKKQEYRGAIESSLREVVNGTFVPVAMSEEAVHEMSDASPEMRI